MATYGLRLRLEHDDFTGALNRFDILERDYTGVADVRTLEGEEPCRISWGDRSGDELPTIYGSEAVLNFFTDLDFEFLYLFTADSKKYRLDHYYNDSLFWTGFLAPENWSEPLIAPPYQVTATATDGLGALKNEYFPKLTGRKTILEIIATILTQTGLSLPINTCVDWKESLQAVGTDPMTQHYEKVESLETLDSYNCLERRLPGCRIFQRLGQWWIVSYTALKNDTITYHKYGPDAGLISSGNTINVKALDYWIQNEPQLEILPAIKHEITIQDYGYIENLIINGSFGTYDNNVYEFETWENIGVVPKQLDLDKDGNKYIYLPGGQDFGNKGWGWLTNGVRKTIEIKATTSIQKIGLKYALMGTAASGPTSAVLMFIRVRLIGETNTYVLRRKPWVLREEEFEWVIQSTVAASEHSIPLGSHLVKSEIYGGGYDNAHVKTRAHKIDAIPDHFASFTAAVGGLPEDGLFEIILYVPYTVAPEIAGACYTGVTLSMIDENGENYPLQKSFKVINDLNNNYRPEDKDITLGDYPDINNAEIMYRHGMSRGDESYTTSWTIPGSGSYSFAELVARMLASQHRQPRQVYEIRLHDMVPTLGIIIDDINVTGRRLLENGIAYDNSMGAIEGNYTELLPVSIDGFTVIEAVEFDEKNGDVEPRTSIKEITANPSNLEKIATIVDQDGVPISDSGVFDSYYFISVTGEDGYTRIRPRRRPQVIEFVNESNPKVLNYAVDYEPIFGQYPVATIYTIDELGNRVQRSELPYYILDSVSGEITSIEFTPFAEGAMTGFILLI